MIVLWGCRHYGKSYFTGLFRYNRKDVSLMQIGGKYTTHQWKYNNGEQHRIKYFRYEDDSYISTDIKTDILSSEDLLNYDTDKGIRTREFVEEDYIGYGVNNPPVSESGFKMDTWRKTNRKLYPIYADHGSVWNYHFFNDITNCDLLVPQPHDTIWYESFIKFFRKCRNIITYKEDILDITIARVNIFESKATNKSHGVNVKNVEDAYYTDKNLVWSHLDDFVRNNRNVEQKLKDHNIPYEYINLDTHDYKTLCDNKLPRRHGVIRYNKDSERYKFAERISKEYIHTRGLTDTRLSGRLTDSI